MSEVLNVHAYDWVVKDRAGDDDQTVIDCWALDVESVPCLLRIIDFPVFCFIELPSYIKNKEFKWTLPLSKTLMITINKLLGDNPSIKSEFFYCQKLYYYQGSRKSPFIRAYFRNVREMNSCKYKLDNAIYTENWGCIKCTVFENQISVLRKLLTLKNIRFSKWFEVIGVKVEEELKISTLENEYIINWQSMKPIPDEICSNWITNPGTLSWDIECYSDNHLAMPDKYNDAHVAYMISAIYKKYKIHSTIKRYGILIGDCHHIPEEKLSNCVLIKVNSEYEMVEAFAKVIKETDPEILVGYNILSFDYPYLDHRVLRQCCVWPHMSRLIGEIPTMNSTNWKSSAYGNNSNNLKISGRISIDLLPIIRRDNKFESYTLNYVCTKFLDKQKNDVSPQEMFIRYEEMQTALKNYETFPDEINALHLDKAKARTTEVMEYCIKDSELVLELMENQDVWIGLIELSNIVGVTIVEIFTKGQQVRCVSQLYDLASRKNIVLNVREETTFRFAGGSVQKPIPGLYENVICLDFKSLYPSIIQALNICYTTLVHPEHMAYIKDEDCHIVEFDQQEEETVYKVSTKIDIEEEVDLDASSDDEEVTEVAAVAEKVMITKHYKFKYYKHKEGLLPLLVKNLVAERNAVRGQQKNEKNPNVKMVLEKRQLALKVSANSTGFNTPIPCLINGKFEYKMIEELFHDNYETLEDGIQLCKGYEGIKVWSDAGWADIHYVGRHEAPKEMMRVLTHTGCVDVTKDHSLLDIDGNEVTVNDVKIGDELMHFGAPLPEDTPTKPMYEILNDPINYCLSTLEEKRAFIYGLFFANGRNRPWSIFNTNLKLMQKCRAILYEITGKEFQLDNTGISYFDEDEYINLYKKLFYNQRQEKIIPNYIFTERYLTRLAFFIGYCSGRSLTNFDRIVEGQVSAAGLYYLSKSLGYHIDILCKNNLFKLQHTENKPTFIKSIEPLYYKNKEYVYDIETSTHHFAAGVGDMIVHNSFFGFLGVREGGKMPCMEAAMSITAKGRELIAEVADYLDKKYEAKIVYGDTDSVMVDLKITDSTLCQYWGEKLSQEISGVKKGQPLPGKTDQFHTEAIPGLFLSPLEMEFEKAMRLFCIKPKKYAAYLINKKGDFIHKCLKDSNGKVIKEYDELEMLIRGIVLARRDNNMFLRILYAKILNIIMSKGKFKDAILLLIDTILDLLNNKIHPKDLKSTRELGAHYKQPSFFMKVFADELRKKNKIVNPGDRLEFVVIENKEATLAGQRMVLMSDYLDSLETDTHYKLDYIHYIEKVLVNPIDQLFEIGFMASLELLKHIEYKPANKRSPITLKNPCEMMFHMVKNNLDPIKCLNEFRKALVWHIDRMENPLLSKFDLNVK